MNNELLNKQLINDAAFGNTDSAKEALDNGADVNACIDGRTAIIMATSNGNYDLVKLLIKHGVNIEVIDNERWTPLYTAASYNYPDILVLLLNNGANIETQHKEEGDWTPLHTAAWNGHLDIVKTLIEYGANINAEDDQNRTPLDLAIEEDNTIVIEFIEDYLKSLSEQGSLEILIDSKVGQEHYLAL